MAQLLTQVQGRHALKQVLNSPLPSLTRFNVEPCKIQSFGRCANMALQNEAGFSRISGLYNNFSPVMSGFLPNRVKFKINLTYANYIAKKYAWSVGFVISVTKAVTADVVAQKIIERKEKLDYKRTGLFFAFGALYSGMFLYGLYAWVYPFIFRSRFHKLNALGGVLADNLVNTPFIFFPTLYVMKAYMLEPNGSLQTAYEKYKSEIAEAAVTGWKIWIPAHIITFGVIPTYLRVPYVSCVSFFYFTIVSFQQTVFQRRRAAEDENNHSLIEATV